MIRVNDVFFFHYEARDLISASIIRYDAAFCCPERRRLLGGYLKEAPLMTRGFARCRETDGSVDLSSCCGSLAGFGTRDRLLCLTVTPSLRP